MTWGELIKGLLEELEYSQCKLAKELKISRSNINDYIKGTRKPSAKTIIKLVHFANQHHLKFDLSKIKN